jgi:cbb3-type cytochrome oxidase maturation protein
MSVLFIALPLALLLAAGAVWAFSRAMRTGQFDDLETPAMRVLFDDADDDAAEPAAGLSAKSPGSGPRSARTPASRPRLHARR